MIVGWWREWTGAAERERLRAVLGDVVARVASDQDRAREDRKVFIEAMSVALAQPKTDPLEGEERRLRVEMLEHQLARMDMEAGDKVAPPPPPKIPCTCGSVHFTAGGQVVSARSDGRCVPDGAVLSCVRCGRRWAQCGGELVEPSSRALPPSWAAQDLHERVQAESGGAGGSADLGQLRGASRRVASQSLKPPPRRS